MFDGTLKQALAVDLDQSPFLRVVPPARVQKTLTFMGRSPDERLTTDLARDLCLRVPRPLQSAAQEGTVATRRSRPTGIFGAGTVASQRRQDLLELLD